jgi:metal-responsive CopG/Arc/MetJ family transcriptional regulator
MSKKVAAIRLDEKTQQAISEVAKETGGSVSELIRDAIKVYIEIYEKKKEGGKIKFYIKSELDKTPCEVLMPWLR